MLRSIRGVFERHNTGLLWTAGASIAAGTLLGVAVDHSRAATPLSSGTNGAAGVIAPSQQPKTALRFAQKPPLGVTNRAVRNMILRYVRVTTMSVSLPLAAVLLTSEASTLALAAASEQSTSTGARLTWS